MSLGVDIFFGEGHYLQYKDKRIGLITNQTGVNRDLVPTAELFKRHGLKVTALFGPEHGIAGCAYAGEAVADGKSKQGPAIYSLMGKVKRPTAEMMQEIDLFVYDIQDIGVRPYTYTTTLFYVMEEAVKAGKPVIVLDRPNPLGGKLIDGPMLQHTHRSFIGYINVPYCHGMTIGELALFFNKEYKIGCQLTVIAMKGWSREMDFAMTGLSWIPPSPHIPEPITPLYCATTGMLGELGIINIGVGYTLPFKVVGAPWIDAEKFSDVLNRQHLPGVFFSPFHYRPFYGSFKGKDCHGVLIHIRDRIHYRPLDVQFALLGILKSLYPEQVAGAIAHIPHSAKDLFCKAGGTDHIFTLLQKEKFVTWKLIGFQSQEREAFEKQRQPYLRY